MIQYLPLSRFQDVYKRVDRRKRRDLFLMNYNKYLSDHMSDDDILQLIENRINEIRYHIKDINHTIYLFDDDAPKIFGMKFIVLKLCKGKIIQTTDPFFDENMPPIGDPNYPGL